MITLLIKIVISRKITSLSLYDIKKISYFDSDIISPEGARDPLSLFSSLVRDYIWWAVESARTSSSEEGLLSVTSSPLKRC